MLKKILFTSSHQVVVHRWKVQVGDRIRPGTVLFVYNGTETGKLVKFKSRVFGTVASLTSKQGVINPGDEVLKMEDCTHSDVVNGLCAICGVDLDNESATSASIGSTILPTPHIKPTNQEGDMVERCSKERLLVERRLVLLVDLDLTLVHSTLNNNIPSNIKDVHELRRDECCYRTRLRPHTHHFLTEMNQYYQLHICTFGTRQYADNIASILDSDKTLFSDRILSREECLHPNSKHANLQGLFPSGDEMVCIIDDRRDVWNNAANLISVKPYVFFTNTGDINSPDPSLPPHQFFAKGVTVVKQEGESMEVDEAESTQGYQLQDEDDYLLYLETILKRVHQRFYQLYDERGECSVKAVLEELRGRVLDKCEIVFSGLVPLHTGIETSLPYLSVHDLGGKISKSVSERTTHIVAARDGTAKIREAKKFPHIHIVTRHWLSECLYRWERVDERLFPLKRIREKDKTCSSESTNAADQPASNCDQQTSDQSETISTSSPPDINSSNEKTESLTPNPQDGDGVNTDLENHTEVISSQASDTCQSDQRMQTPGGERGGKPAYEKSMASLRSIDSLISSFKKERPTAPPAVLDFLKPRTGNSDNVKKFQIPKRVRIMETPQIRLIEPKEMSLVHSQPSQSLPSHSVVPSQSPPRKRKKKNSSKKKSDSNPSSSLLNGDLEFENVDYMKRNKQVMMMKLKQLETSQRILEDEYSLRRRQNQDEFLVRMEQCRDEHAARTTMQNEKHNLTMQTIYSEHEERLKGLQSEHSMRLKQMQEEHEVKLKHLHELQAIRIKSIVSNTSDSDD